MSKTSFKPGHLESLGVFQYYPIHRNFQSEDTHFPIAQSFSPQLGYSIFHRAEPVEAKNVQTDLVILATLTAIEEAN